MYKRFLSFRYFRSRPINFIPVICMMLGVMALIVILAVMDGFQAQLRATLRGSLSDLSIGINYDSDFEKWEEFLGGIEGIEAISPHLKSFALVADIPMGPQSRTAMQGAMVLGIDADREAEASEFRRYLNWRPPVLDFTEGRQPESRPTTPDIERPFTVLDRRWDDIPGVILGRLLARRLGVGMPWQDPDSTGKIRWRYNRVNVTTMVKGQDSGEEWEAQKWEFCVTGIYESGNQDIDEHLAFMDRRVAKEFFELKKDPDEIRIQVSDFAFAEGIKADLNDRSLEIYRKTADDPDRPWTSAVRPIYVLTWEDKQRNFLNAIENEKGLIAIIAGMAFLVTGFMIFSILSMIVTMKTRDIGILKALGATTGGVLRIFMLNGLLVGVIGSTLGLGLGLLFVDNINWVRDRVKELFGWEPFPPGIYLFQEIPAKVIPSEVAIVTGMAMVVALIGAILPALRAARVDPVESLRYE